MKKSKQRREQRQDQERQTTREYWKRIGLLPNAERDYQLGRVGVDWIEHPDTAAAEQIIRQHRSDGHSLDECAEELILLGRDPADPVWVRRWIVGYVEGWITRVNPYQRSRGRIGSDAVPSHDHIQRKIRDVADDKHLSSEARDFLSISFLGANGILPSKMHGVLMPSDALLDWRRLRTVIDNATDMRLVQALAEAREIASRGREELGAKLHIMTHMSASDVARRLVPNHRCKTRHTVAQAMLPRLVLHQIDPLQLSPTARQVNDAVLEIVAKGAPEIGGVFITIEP